LANDWITNYAKNNKATSTLVGDRQVLRDYIFPQIGNNSAKDVSATDIERIVQGLKKENRLSNKTINKVLQLAKSIYNYGIRKRVVNYNPVTAIKLLPLNPISFKYWTDSEVSTFLKYTNEKYRLNRRPFVIYLIALSCGLRMGEIFGLDWDSILFDKRLIIVRHTFDRFTNAVKPTTKGKKIRYVGINNNLLSELHSLKEKYLNSTYLFENENNQVMDLDNFRGRNFLRDIRESGVREIRFHDMRHTFASHYVMNSGNVYDLQQILGHSDTKMTMRYAHLAPEHIAHTAEIVNFSYENKNNNSAQIINFNPAKKATSIS
jgi:integrase